MGEIGPNASERCIVGRSSRHPALIPRCVPRIRPNSGLFQGVLQPVPPGIHPPLLFVHYVPMVCRRVTILVAFINIIRPYAGFSRLVNTGNMIVSQPEDGSSI
jgi:hypothetical protein